MLGEHLHHLEAFQVVYENVGEPQVVDQLQVHRNQGLRGRLTRVDGQVVLGKEAVRDLQPGLLPEYVEVRAEGHRIFLF